MKISAGFLGRMTFVMLASVVIYNSPPCSSAAVSNTRLVNFLWLLSARYSDKKEVAEDLANHEGQVHDQIIIQNNPVKVPGLSSSLTLLGRESLNHKLLRLIIDVVSLDPDGVIRMKVYNVPNMEKYTIDTPASKIMEGITVGDLKEERPGCDFLFSEIESNVFLGTFPDCLDFSNDKAPAYTVLMTCNVLSFISPYNASEAAVPRPYRNTLIPERMSLSPFYDIIGDFSSMKDPCT